MGDELKDLMYKELRDLRRDITRGDEYDVMKCPSCDEDELLYKDGVGELCESCGYNCRR